MGKTADVLALATWIDSLACLAMTPSVKGATTGLATARHETNVGVREVDLAATNCCARANWLREFQLASAMSCHARWT